MNTTIHFIDNVIDALNAMTHWESLPVEKKSWKKNEHSMTLIEKLDDGSENITEIVF